MRETESSLRRVNIQARHKISPTPHAAWLWGADTTTGGTVYGEGRGEGRGRRPAVCPLGGVSAGPAPSGRAQVTPWRRRDRGRAGPVPPPRSALSWETPSGQPTRALGAGCRPPLCPAARLPRLREGFSEPPLWAGSFYKGGGNVSHSRGPSGSCWHSASGRQVIDLYRGKGIYHLLVRSTH